MAKSTDISGLSLIELLVVIAILGLAVAIVPPMLGNVMESSMLKQASREIASGLKQVRTHAITQQKQAGFHFDVNNAEYSYGNRSIKLDIPASTLIKFTTAESELDSRTSGAIRFFADGSSTGGRIILKAEQQQYSIDVDWLTGQIKITP